VFTAGDNTYDDGTASEYSRCYAPSWGAFRSRTRPALGNHEYNTGGAGASFDYFGSRLGERGKGYYSYNLGAWHIVVLNSNRRYVSTDATSAQLRWLKADLAATTRRCILAYWHHPRFYSGGDSVPPPYPPVKSFWDALYAGGADVVINAHQHFYERFAPQAHSGSADPQGIREFIVGTGGKSTGPTPRYRRRNSEVAHGGDREFGVLELTLGDGGYSWRFRPVAGKSWSDRGSGGC
jgi:alkaline phosphatase